METIYFFCFCVGIAGIIAWALKADDYQEFNKDAFNKKFSLKKPTVEPPAETDDHDEPKANLL